MGCSIRKLADAPARRAASLTARRSTAVMADGTQISTLGRFDPADADPVQEHAQHPFGDFEVGDGAAAQRALGHDVARRAADHLPGVGPDGQDLPAARVERDDGRLVQDEALALGVDQRVGGTKVDGQVARHGASWYGRAIPRRHFQGRSRYRRPGERHARGATRGRAGPRRGCRSRSGRPRRPAARVDRPRRPAVAPPERGRPGHRANHCS